MLQNATIAQNVKEYIMSQMCIYECLKKGIINYSQLAQVIAKEYRLDSTAAIKMAIKRFADTETEKEDDSDMVWNVLSRAKVTIKPDVSIIVVEPSPEAFAKINEIEQNKLVTISSGETLYIIREQTAIVIIIEKDKRERAREMLKGTKIIRIKENATPLVVISPQDIVTTPGVLNNIISHFALNKVNIEEIISCYRDTIIIVDENDSAKGFQIVKNLTMS